MRRVRTVSLAAAGMLLATQLAGGGSSALASTKWTDTPATADADKWPRATEILAGRNWAGAPATTDSTKWT